MDVSVPLLGLSTSRSKQDDERPGIPIILKPIVRYVLHGATEL